MQNQMTTAVQFMENYENELLASHRLDVERENKIKSVFQYHGTRHIIMGFKKEKIQTERIKTEEGLIKKYFDIKLEDEIKMVKSNCARVLKGEWLISSPRDVFQSAFKRHLKEHIATEFRQYGKNKTFEYIFNNNEDVIRRQTHRVLKKLTVECEKYFDIMQTRSEKKNSGEQFIIEHEGVTYKLFNRAGRRVKSEINKKFVEQYITEDICTDNMDRKFRRSLWEYEKRYK